MPGPTISVSAMVFAMVLGMVWGSFVGVLVDRIPKGLSVVRGRSRCDACERPLTVVDLVPVLSWISSRGRCRGCGSRITARWTAIELACGVLAVSAWMAARGDIAIAVLLGGFLGVLVGLAMIDLDHGRLPNAIVYPTGLVAAVLILATGSLGGHLAPLGAVVGASLYGGGLFAVALLSRGGMGMGDVKLAAVVGLVLGAIDVRAVGVAAGVAVLLGGAVGVIALLRGADRRSAVPFGPMLVAGAIVGALAGGPVADAYLGWFR